MQEVVGRVGTPGRSGAVPLVGNLELHVPIQGMNQANFDPLNIVFPGNCAPGGTDGPELKSTHPRDHREAGAKPIPGLEEVSECGEALLNIRSVPS